MNFNIAADRRNTNSIKWNREAIENISANPVAEPFWVADMDFLPEPHIQEAGRVLAGLGVYGYPSFPKDTAAVSQWLRQKHGWIMAKENIIFAQGLLHALALSINLFSKEGASLLVPSPMYRPFREIPKRNNRKLIEHNLGYEDGLFYLDKERFRADAENADMIIFCSPQNPSGLVFSKEDLEFVLQTAKERNIPIISDEIHSDLAHPEAKHIPMGLANERIGAKCITLFAPSKTFNIAGEHCAFAVFSDDEMEKAFRDAESALWLDEPGLSAGELAYAAYTKGSEYNKELCRYLGESIEAMRKYLSLSCPGMKIVNGQASFVTFIDCKEYYQKIEAEVLGHPDRYSGGEGGGILSRFFGVAAGVAVNDGTWFGSEWKEFVRFNYGTSRDRVMKALERMVRAVKAL
ncbi:MAG: aminotransferase class I/II-fold pyridoxal phosphate-dependent enzyme [Spirochaetes bacterium]|uniref:cysteine-S-conjugate beta-lyase n=1 Tax=Candidatus Ornithospirochaeta stercoripullorum TaxID=2840899 RepID=A0A9D9H5N8_9SPIO|nr:aminotransferase class I/II-fold pyridoxal phosphate-dependent enzyme [Candidatus Ornithospirochaeta stercoripullorum]